MDKRTSIQISGSTKNLIAKLGKKGESYEDIILKYLPVRCSFGTDDSYSTSYPYRSIDSIIEFIKHKRNGSEWSYNRYSGGKVDSKMATIDCFRPGFVYNGQILLQFVSEAQCRAFENRIKPLFTEDNFRPRVFLTEGYYDD